MNINAAEIFFLRYPVAKYPHNAPEYIYATELRTVIPLQSASVTIPQIKPIIPPSTGPQTTETDITNAKTIFGATPKTEIYLVSDTCKEHNIIIVTAYFKAFASFNITTSICNYINLVNFIKINCRSNLGILRNALVFGINFGNFPDGNTLRVNAAESGGLGYIADGYL